ncbi:MAG: SLC13 family permease [Candidatus Thorarchaeota archaeon]
MVISILIILCCFFGVIILILAGKNRAVSSLFGALIVYFVLIYVENKDFIIIIDLLFGTAQDNYSNVHSLILIISIMIIIQISSDAGLFQVLAISLVKLSKGKPLYLMTIFCIVCLILATVLNNVLSIIILIPLTITVSRILNVDPSPYILTQAVLVNLGATMFSISSIPNVLITIYAGISFIDFLLNVGVVSLITFGFSIPLFLVLYRKEIKIKKEDFEILKEFDTKNFIQNKGLLIQSVIALLSLMTLFIILPSTFIPPDIIALSIALTLIIVSKLNPREIISKIDIELILYLLGIFIIAGALESTGILDSLGELILSIGGGLYTQIIIVMWISAFLSSSIDNVPITQILLPVISTMTLGFPIGVGNQLYYGLAIGANWGDNLTPLGDNIFVIQIAEKNKRPISFKKFFKLGFFTTIYQLSIVTVYYTLVFQFFQGLIIIITISVILLIVYAFIKLAPKKSTKKLISVFSTIKNYIIK